MKPTAVFFLIITAVFLFAVHANDAVSQQELGLVPFDQPDINEFDLGLAINSHAHSSVREVIFHTMPGGGCPPCDFNESEWGGGFPGVKVTKIVGGAESYPWVRFPDRPTFVDPVDGREKPLYWHKISKADLIANLEKYHPAKRTAAAMVMTELKIGKSVDALFDLIKPSGRDTIIPVGSGDILVPAGTQTSVSNNGGTLTLSFSGAVKPQFRFALLRLDISGVDLTRDKVTIKMPGFPDLSAKVVD